MNNDAVLDPHVKAMKKENPAESSTPPIATNPAQAQSILETPNLQKMRAAGPGKRKTITTTVDEMPITADNGGNGNGNHSNGKTDIDVSALPVRPAVALINKLAQNPAGHADFTLKITRRLPTYTMVIAPCLMNAKDLRVYIASELGAGHYLVNICRDGVEIPGDEEKYSFNIAIQDHEVPAEANPGRASASGEDDPIKSKKKEIELLKLEQQEKKIKAESTIKTPETLAMEQQIRDLEKRIDENNRRGEKKDSPSLIEIVTAVSAALTPLMLPLVEMIKTSRANPPVDNTKELAKMMMDSQQRATDTQMSFLKILMEQKAVTTDPMKMIIEAEERAEKRIDRMYERFDQQNEGNNAGGIDPRAGWHNLWVIAERVAEKLAEKSPEMMSMFEQRFNKPAAQRTREEELTLAQELHRQNQEDMRRAAPKPAPKKQVSANVTPMLPQKIPVAPRQPASQPDETPKTAVVATAPIVVPTGEDDFESVVDGEIPVVTASNPPAAVETPVSSVAPAAPGGVVQDDLYYRVLEVIDDMVTDIKQRRLDRGAIWPESALQFWAHSFLDELQGMRDGVDRMNAVRNKVNPADWTPVYAALQEEEALLDSDKAKREVSFKFYATFDGLAFAWQEWKERAKENAQSEPESGV